MEELIFQKVQKGDMIFTLEKDRRSGYPIFDQARVLKVGESKPMASNGKEGFVNSIELVIQDSISQITIYLPTNVNEGIYNGTYYTTNLDNIINEVSMQKQNALNILNNLNAQLMTVTSTIKNIKNIDQELSNNHDIYQCYLDLSEVTSGKNSYRISFERYVLAAYFENILVYANTLLKRMSQGRYQLYRRDNRSKGAGKQGLELDVLDLESGLLRDVKTLSGGESFKAALSLALGLSKMIQGYAGGIELNTLFIDEGFGSLDSQSLDQAIDCLIDIQQDGKLIGIISHVSELKERIDHKIILSRKNKETKIAIE